MKSNYLLMAIHFIASVFAANCYMAVRLNPLFWIVEVVCIVITVILPSRYVTDFPTKKLGKCYYGAVMCRTFLVDLVLSIAVFIYSIRLYGTEGLSFFVPAILIPTVVLSALFWIGMINMYINSAQLGIVYRGIGLLLGMIPIANIVMLIKMISVASDEARTEYDKDKLNKMRAPLKVCKTRYPLLMVHGVFFRDYDHFQYWGRIPEQLIMNGATIYYGEHESANSVEQSAQQIYDRLINIVNETGCEKVNIIAHSKGGLDVRYALNKLGMSKYVASVTCINTPNRGCAFADYLLSKAPEALKTRIANGYNATLLKFGDKSPDFIAAVNDLTGSRCSELNEMMSDEDETNQDVYTRSIGSVMNKPSGGRFPLDISTRLVKLFDGRNDGLVGENSFSWGQDYQFIEPSGKRGISHGDVIDLNRENIKGFDVREFYVGLVADLKKRGL